MFDPNKKEKSNIDFNDTGLKNVTIKLFYTNL